MKKLSRLNKSIISEEDFDIYQGKWIAVYEGLVITSGNSAIDVFNAFKEIYKKGDPLIVKLPTREELEKPRLGI